jgi:hypothetical protein
MAAPILQRVRRHLKDKDMIVSEYKLPPELCDWDAMHGETKAKYFDSFIVRRHFVTENGIRISIQQGYGNYCNNPHQVEMWYCPHLPILDGHGDGSDPYGYVPVSLLVRYIECLENMPEYVVVWWMFKDKMRRIFYPLVRRYDLMRLRSSAKSLNKAIAIHKGTYQPWWKRLLPKLNFKIKFTRTVTIRRMKIRYEESE